MADVRVLQILLGDTPVGHITGFRDGKNLFSFEESYVALGSGRPVLSMSFNIPGDEQATEKQLTQVHASRMKLPPFFSNLLPEGVLREYMVKNLKVHHDHEFDILTALGASLPGAVRAIPATELPRAALEYRPGTSLDSGNDKPLKFSLGGSQLKFSMVERGGRFTLEDGKEEWIVKPPHPTHPDVPANEYTMMKLAAAAGVDVPEAKIVKLDSLELPRNTGIFVPQWEPWAYAVRRYDRSSSGRVHAEDFAQVFGVYADQEYKATNYDTMARLIFDLFPNRHDQLAEFIRRLVVNILIGNGDAHLKNWSVIYRDGVTPQLAPAYDLVSTVRYIQGDRLALNLAGEKRFQAFNEQHFEKLATRAEAPPKFALDVVRETVALARDTWPRTILELGLPEHLRASLEQHWAGLSELLRITA